MDPKESGRLTVTERPQCTATVSTTGKRCTLTPIKGETVCPAHARDRGKAGRLRRQCTAKAKSTGKRCTRSAIKGGTVCPMHGGMAPQVQASARARLAALAVPAVATLGRELVKAEKSVDRQRAANSILDRTGYGRTVRLEESVAVGIMHARLDQMLGLEEGEELDDDGEIIDAEEIDG